MSWHGHNQPPPFLDSSNGALSVNDGHYGLARSNTPIHAVAALHTSQLGNSMGGELGRDDDQRLAIFKECYTRSEAKIALLFGSGASGEGSIDSGKNVTQEGPANEGQHAIAAPPKKLTRTFEEDYDDYDVDDDDADQDDAISSPLKARSTNVVAGSIKQSPAKPIVVPSSSGLVDSQDSTGQDQGKTSEDVRKKLEEDKRATEDAAKRSFHTLFYTLENDRDTMLEQQKLEESDRQVDAEMSGTGNQGINAANTSAGVSQHGTLSSANLGASSLTLKHLIARIDAKREQVRASDAELRSLMSEVRKNRSKWANEEKVGQEELYEAAEKVLSELKAMTEHSTAFLGRVNKREAPDYYQSKYSRALGCTP